MEHFIQEILSQIPAGSYHDQAEAELREHLLAAIQELESAGYEPEQARQEALSRMGNPTVLKRNYREAFLRRQAVQPRYCLGSLWKGCLWIGAGYLTVCAALSSLGFTYDAVYRNRPSFPMQGNPLYLSVYSALLFLIPFCLGTVILWYFFRYYPRPAVMVTLGLLLAWLGEKMVICSLSALIYAIPIWRLPTLLGRISGGGDPTAPWFTPRYILLTFAGCLLLGAVSALFQRPGNRVRT